MSLDNIFATFKIAVGRKIWIEFVVKRFKILFRIRLTPQEVQRIQMGGT